MAVIEALDVHKTYRRFRKPPKAALAGIDLVVEEGGVHGFLGPNGSGKTTLLRCLLGLARADSGDMRILNAAVPKRLPAVIGTVGALLESPAFFPPYSGRSNLTLLATSQRISHQRVDDVLELVGLTDAATDKVKGYSLGMRQRLAIAAALLKAPQVLILDEPSNGLDPAGMKEVRELLRQLGNTGTTVLVSSHLLGEVQQICDDVTIVSHGRLVTSGAVRDVLAARSTGDVRVEVADLTTAQRVLFDAGITSEILDAGLVARAVADPSTVTKALAEANLYLSALTPIQADLEQAFLELTSDEPAIEGDVA